MKRKKARKPVLKVDPQKLIDPSGVVEKYTKRELSGWMQLTSLEEPRKVDLYLDDIKVASTWTAFEIERTGAKAIRGFRFKLKRIWDYCNPSSELSVRCGDGRLLIVGHGFSVAPKSVGTQSTSELAGKIASGMVFNQFGSLQLSREHDASWRTDIISLYRRLDETFRARAGRPLSVCYGTSLGAVRQGDFIGHDHDFDTCFFCEAENPADAKLEALSIFRKMRDAGFSVAMKPSCAYISHPELPGSSIDVFHLYFDESQELQFPFGTASIEPFLKAEFTGYTEVSLGGEMVTVPSDPELFVSRIYGPNWRIPNSGFNWGKDRVRRANAGRFSTGQIEKFYGEAGAKKDD